MDQILILLGNSSFFASRAFLPALITILSYRFPEYIPFVQTSFQVSPEASWFFTDVSLYIFLTLSILEMAATKNPDIRQFLDPFMEKVKMVVAVGVNLSLLDPETLAVVNQVSLAGFSLSQLWALLSGAIVYNVSTMRSAFYEFLTDFDEDDDLKLQLLLTTFEDLFVIVGVVLLIAIPLLVVSVVGLLLLLFHFQQRRLEALEESTKVPCAHCGELILPAATQCQRCHNAVEAPKAIGHLGQMSAKPAESRQKQEVELVAARRCPHCAEKIKRGELQQHCLCGCVIHADHYRGLLAEKRRELLPALAILALVGLVPVAGMIAAILYIKMLFIKPLKQYLPRNTIVGGKLLLRLVTLLFIPLQAIPFAGAIIPPLLLLLNYFLWTKLFRERVALLE